MEPRKSHDSRPDDTFFVSWGREFFKFINMIAPTLKGKISILKPMEPKYAAARFKWYHDLKVEKFQSFGFSSLEGIRKSIIKRRKADDSLAWVIFTKDDKLIGEIQLKEIIKEFKSAKLGMNIGETDFWNQGYGTDALKSVCRYFFTRLKYNRIELSVFEKNLGAIRVYEKCGFKKEGFCRKAYLKKGKYHNKVIMGLIREDYKKLK